MSILIHSLPDALHRFNFNAIASSKVQTLNRRRFLITAAVRPQKYPADFPEHPDADSLRHLENVAVASAYLAEALCKSFESRQWTRRIQQFACLTKVFVWTG